MLIWIGVANAILWSGLILALLLVLVRNTRRAEALLDRLERDLGVDEMDEIG